MKTATLSLATIFLASAIVPANGQAAKAEPVFSAAAAGLSWIEAEGATATNFGSEAVLDYGSSGYRTLQLNREGRSAPSVFYAEYGFSLDSGGVWSLWMGGTPPGPESELLASFVSPIRVSIDGGEYAPLYREGVEVCARYSTTNYWFVAKPTFKLAEGPHTIRFEVSEPRKYDSRFYFHLDAFFLLEAGSPARSKEGSSAGQPAGQPAGLPAAFPADLSDRRIDQAYLSIPQYEYAIQTAPKDKERYLLLAQVYGLLGDHGSAIKTLARGRIVAGDDIRFTLQMAKSRIWSGEIDEGLRLYREYLSSPDADPSVWAEAAKISAWLMKYRDSEALYRDALERMPGDVNLEVNYGLTLLWENRAAEGERILAEAWRKAKEAPDAIARLASIYLVSGYADRAIKSYEGGIELYPDALDLYLSLADVYAATDGAAGYEKTIAAIRERFAPSARLDAAIAAKTEAAGLKAKALAEYERRLAEAPDNVELRLELLRAYYWNGMLDEALSEADAILVNRLYSVLAGLDQDLAVTYRLLDGASLQARALRDASTAAAAMASTLRKADEALLKAKARSTLAEKGKDAKKKEKAAQESAAAEAAAGSALAEALSFLEWAAAAAESAKATVSEAGAEASLREADAELVAKLAPWDWDADAELSYLARLEPGNVLAGYARARLASILGKPEHLRAPSTGSEAPAAAFAPTERVLAQASLWSKGVADFEAMVRAGYYAHLDELAETAAVLAWESAGGEGAAEPFAAEEARRIAASLDSFAKESAELSTALQTSAAELAERARLRLRARAYQYDTETQADRRELADVYLKLKKPAEAVAALDRVLAVNPSDSSSTFTLGRAMEIAEDWSGAMRAYRAVYDLNPRYESAVSSYNRLAGLHAARLSADIASTVDSSESIERSSLGYEASFNSMVGMKARYELARTRVHAPAAGSFPVSAALHTVELGLPIAIPGSGWIVEGKVGGTLKNRLGDFLPPDVDDYGDEGISAYAEAAPRLGASVGWARDAWGVAASYAFDQVEDTFYDDRLPHYEHRGALNGSWYASSPSRNLAKTLSARASASAASVALSPAYAAAYPDAPANLIWSAQGAFVVRSLIGGDPRLAIDLTIEASYEDSSEPEVDDYYAPSRVVLVKGGPSMALALGRRIGEGLGIRARIWPGYYSSAGIGRLYLDGSLEVSGAPGKARLFARADASYAAATGSSAAWWSGAITLGATVYLGDYIIP